ncbi:NAD(P)-binding domain-containing protein, partial [Stenotrophomonas maltophilia]|uniref:NAD(P)-binding domain-containing protein n=1 Tax=Stenotrophomonas maltophilia TaxID=40324 RepID=UPI003D33992B
MRRLGVQGVHALDRLRSTSRRTTMAPASIRNKSSLGRTGMTIGFIGLGRMGRGMASNLQTKGFSLMVHD